MHDALQDELAKMSDTLLAPILETLHSDLQKLHGANATSNGAIATSKVADTFKMYQKRAIARTATQEQLSCITHTVRANVRLMFKTGR